MYSSVSVGVVHVLCACARRYRAQCDVLVIPQLVTITTHLFCHIFVLVLLLVFLVLVLLLLLLLVVVVVVVVVATELIVVFLWTPNNRQIGGVFVDF